MTFAATTKLAGGIVPVLQTPFSGNGEIDPESLTSLVNDALRQGAHGLLAPVVASEVEFLSRHERQQIIELVSKAIAGRVPFIVGTSSSDPAECRYYAQLAEKVGAAAYLVAIPGRLYGRFGELWELLRSIAEATRLPLLLQDLDWNGPGLAVPELVGLREKLPTLAGIKIETVPAGPKYSAVRRALNKEFFIAGGWAIPQMIEALDRGVDALIPESSMVAVYSTIWRAHVSGDRAEALQLFRRLLPVLAFTNQEIGLATAFFKRLLVHKKIFRTEVMRRPWAGWDEYNSRIADELIAVYMELEHEVKEGSTHITA